MVGTTRFWVAPVAGVLAACLLVAAALTIDGAVGWSEQPPPPLFSGSAGSARSLLSSIAGAGTSLLTLVFTIITVVIQLATGQYSARVLRTLYTDRPSHITIGVFVMTISYSLITLLRVSDSGDPLGVTVMVAVVLAVLAVVTFAVFAHHVAHLVRVGSLVAIVAADTRRVIDAQMSDPIGDGGQDLDAGQDRPDLGSSTPVVARKSGVLVEVDSPSLLDVAQSADVVVELAPAVGDFVPEGAVLFRVFGKGVNEAELFRCVEFGDERRLDGDVAWGLRILVDICLRALSPSVNDPTTAVQAIDRIHEQLRVLGQREMPASEWHDARGELRLVVRSRGWEEYVELSLDEVRRAGSQHVQVLRRLRALLLDVSDAVPPARRQPLDRRLQLVDIMMREFDDRDVRVEADAQGIGGPNSAS